MKTGKLLFDSVKTLRKITSSKNAAFKEAESIILFTLGISREKLFMMLNHDISAVRARGIKNLVKKRARGYPLQYIIEKENFYLRDFIVKPGVLIPRPDTEAVIDCVKEAQKRLKGPVTAAECGCGSGAIGITLLKEVKSIKEIYCYDISKAAAALTRQNALIHGVKSKMKIYKSDFFSKKRKGRKKFRLVVSNPPYVKTEDMKKLQPEVKKEPAKALRAGKDGLFYYRKFAGSPGLYLEKGGLLVLEAGDDMMNKVKKLFAERGWEAVNMAKDFRGRPRAAAFSFPCKKQK